MSLWLFPLAFLGWLAASTLIGWALGTVLRHNTEDPPDLLDFDDITFDWPKR